MSRKFNISLIILLILIIPFSSSFTYEVEPILVDISINDAARYKITVINDLDAEDWFTISTRDVNWVLTSEPTLAKIAPFQKITFDVYLRPKPDLIDDNVYVVPIKIKSEKSETFKEEGSAFSIRLSSSGKINYTPTVTPSISIEKVVDPREPVSVQVNLRNRNRRDLENLNISLLGGTEINRQYLTDLKELEEKVNEVLFRIDPHTKPGQKTLFLKITFNNKTIAESSTEYEILGYVDMQETVSKSARFFKTEETFQINNNGNQIGLAEKAIKMGLFERAFTRFSPQAEKQKGNDGKTYYVVTEQIKPQESITIKVTTNYRLLVTLILLTLISTILYFVLRSPVIIYKSADPIGKLTPEGLSEVKVRLYLRNRSGKQVTNIKVIDTIPTIAEIKKSSHVGSMDPVNLSKGKKGTIARWEFASLEPYEERVIAYKIESKLKLVGGIKLPSGKVKFESKKGSERSSYSNPVNLTHKFDQEN